MTYYGDEPSVNATDPSSNIINMDVIASTSHSRAMEKYH